MGWRLLLVFRGRGGVGVGEGVVIVALLCVVGVGWFGGLVVCGCHGRDQNFPIQWVTYSLMFSLAIFIFGLWSYGWIC